MVWYTNEIKMRILAYFREIGSNLVYLFKYDITIFSSTNLLFSSGCHRKSCILLDLSHQIELFD